MGYHFSKTVDVTFDQAVARVIEALKQEGLACSLISMSPPP
jgi:uncharacterized protein (DUF302 family)